MEVPTQVYCIFMLAGGVRVAANAFEASDQRVEGTIIYPAKPQDAAALFRRTLAPGQPSGHRTVIGVTSPRGVTAQVLTLLSRPVVFHISSVLQKYNIRTR